MSDIRSDIWIPKAKTEMKISYYTLYFNKRFNWFQKKMIKFCFGVDEINDIE